MTRERVRAKKKVSGTAGCPIRNPFSFKDRSKKRKEKSKLFHNKSSSHQKCHCCKRNLHWTWGSPECLRGGELFDRIVEDDLLEHQASHILAVCCTHEGKEQAQISIPHFAYTLLVLLLSRVYSSHLFTLCCPRHRELSCLKPSSSELFLRFFSPLVCILQGYFGHSHHLQGLLSWPTWGHCNAGKVASFGVSNDELVQIAFLGAAANANQSHSLLAECVLAG